MSNIKLDTAKAARYWGCTIKTKEKLTGKLVGIFSTHESCNIELIDNSISVGHKLSDCQLLLTPLSAITDEHAIEVAKIASIGKYEAKECIGCDKDDYKTIGKYIVADFNYPTYIDVRIHTDKYIKIIDLLRSLGYDCDNAISEGWAVDRLAFVK